MHNGYSRVFEQITRDSKEKEGAAQGTGHRELNVGIGRPLKENNKKDYQVKVKIYSSIFCPENQFLISKS